jgi:hypothetical protein
MRKGAPGSHVEMGDVRVPARVCLRVGGTVCLCPRGGENGGERGRRVALLSSRRPPRENLSLCMKLKTEEGVRGDWQQAGSQ